MNRKIEIDRSSLFPPQKELLSQGFLDSKDNWIIVSPTGSGKTLVAEWAIRQTIDKGYRAAYLAPLRAIVEEKYTEWEQTFDSRGLGLFTGETTRRKNHTRPSSQQLLLLTPEKLASYLQNWKRNLTWLSKLDLLVIDEFHLIGDRFRGACIESLISRLQRINPFCRFIALTATLTNATELGAWLNAKVFQSHWRPIPLTRRIETFKKVEAKAELLKIEIDATLKTGGRVLVFVNSRKRSEVIASNLKEQGYRADFNHAGIGSTQRAERRTDMQDGATDILITTSALEMGVNFPARKVVIYDSYGFDGESFKPLSIQRYLQCAGRAGRPGLDESGEAIIFVPVWRKNAIDYLNGTSEEITSGLFSSDTILREVLVEISSRLSVSNDHLSINFAQRSWWNSQGGISDLSGYVDELIDGGMVKRDSKEQYYLSATALGRVASQMSVCPATVLLFAKVYREHTSLGRFDLLLLVCLARETTPKLGFNFEEIDNMADVLLCTPSEFLNQTTSAFQASCPHIKPKQLLSAIKCATVLYQRTQGQTLDTIAEQFDCYPSDLAILVSNACWTLEAAKRVFNILHDADYRRLVEDESDPPEKQLCKHVELMTMLTLLLQYGIPEQSLGLTKIPHIGPTRARKLIDAGITNLSEFCNADKTELGCILRLREQAIDDIRQKAQDAIEPTFGFHLETSSTLPAVSDKWDSEIDPYRLRRALELDVPFSSPEVVRVTGGAEPHSVTIEWLSDGGHGYHCDCADFASGTTHCKHIIRARLEVQDADEILRLLRLLQTSRDRPLRYCLGDLWMKIGNLYDRFNDRDVDYSGKKFLGQAVARERWAAR